MMDDLLYDLYYVKHNYDEINNLYKKAKLSNNKITKNDVKLWLSKQSTYQQNFSKVEKKTFLTFSRFSGLCRPFGLHRPQI